MPIKFIERGIDDHLVAYMDDNSWIDLGEIPTYVRKRRGGGPIGPPVLRVYAGGPYIGLQSVATEINGSYVAGEYPVSGTLWEIQSGPGTGTFANATALTTTFTPNAIGTYTLKFTATPSVGAPVVALATFVSTTAESFKILSESGDFLITEDSNNIVNEAA